MGSRRIVSNLASDPEVLLRHIRTSDQAVLLCYSRTSDTAVLHIASEDIASEVFNTKVLQSKCNYFKL